MTNLIIKQYTTQRAAQRFCASKEESLKAFDFGFVLKFKGARANRHHRAMLVVNQLDSNVFQVELSFNPPLANEEIDLLPILS